MGGGIRVLHVDDDAEIRSLTRQFLETSEPEFDVVVVAGAQEGLERIESEPIDCVLSDYDMPGMDGIEFLETVRESYPGLPFILFTGKGSEEIASEAIRSGVTDYIQKSPGREQFELLANRIQNAIESARARQSARQNEERFERLSQSFPDLAIYLSAEGRYLDVITGAENGLLYRDATELTGNRLDAVLPEEKAERFREVITDCIETGRNQTIEYQLPVPAGERWFEAVVVPLDEPVEGENAVMWVARDVTGRKERERELRATKDRMEFALEATDSYIFEIDLDSGVETRHGSFERLYGFAPGEVPDSETFYREAVHPDDRETVRHVQQEKAPDNPGTSFELEYRTNPDHGDVRWLWAVGYVTGDDQSRFIGLTTDITERKQQEVELANQRRKYQTLTEELPDIIYRADPNTLEPQYINDSIEEIMGYTPEEWLENPDRWAESIHREDRDRVFTTFREAREAPEDGIVEYRVFTRDGEMKWVRNRFRWEREESGEIVSLLGIVRDITDQRAFQQELEMKSRAMDEAPIGITITDPSQEDNPIIYANDGFSEITGYPIEDILGRNCRFLQGPDTREEPVAEMRQAIDSKEPVSVDIRNYRKDGTEFWNRVWIAPVFDAGTDSVDNYVGFQRDVTAEKRREREIGRSNALLSTLFRTMPFGVLAQNADREVIAASDQVLDLFGIEASSEPIVGRRCEELEDAVRKHVSSPESFLARIETMIEAGESVQNETVSLSNGDTVSLRYEPIPMGDEEGHLWIFRDISDRQAYERMIKSLHEVAGELAECDSEQAIYDRTIEAAGELLEMDRAAVAIERDGYLEVAAMSAAVPMEERPRFDNSHGIAGKTYQQQVPLLVDDARADPDADPQTVEIRSAMSVPLGQHGVLQVFDDQPDSFDEQDLEVLGLLAHHTERALSLLERQRDLERQNERLENFASVVSHDLRNPLNVAEGHLELAMDECDSDHLSTIEQSHERIMELIERLLALAMSDEPVEDRQPVTLESMVTTCWSTVRTTEAALEVSDPMTIMADRTRLKQLLENLFRNAVEHGGDDVIVRVGPLADERGFFVADDGPGIAPADRDAIFETGYSTRPNGTGFGLAIVADIVEAHGWSIDVTDSWAAGARFEITGVETPDTDSA